MGRPIQWSRRGRESNLEVCVGSGSASGGLKGVRRVDRITRRSGWGQKAYPKVWEAYPEVRAGLGGPPKGPGGVEIPIWRFRRVVRYTRGSGGVVRPTRSSGRVQESNPEVREAYPEVCAGSGLPSEPTRRSGWGQDSHPKVCEVL